MTLFQIATMLGLGSFCILSLARDSLYSPGSSLTENQRVNRAFTIFLLTLLVLLGEAPILLFVSCLLAGKMAAFLLLDRDKLERTQSLNDVTVTFLGLILFIVLSFLATPITLSFYWLVVVFALPTLLRLL